MSSSVGTMEVKVETWDSTTPVKLRVTWHTYLTGEARIVDRLQALGDANAQTGIGSMT